MKDRYLKHDELLDLIDIQIWQFVDPETYGAVNQAHAAFFGVTKNNLEHRKFSEILPLETVEALVDRNSQIFLSGMPISTVKIIRNHKGEERCITITKTPKLNSRKKVEYVVCTGTDITEYKALETDLHHSNATLRTFLAASPIGIGIVENRKISWVNDQMMKMFGCDCPDEVVGRSTREFYADSDDFASLGNEIYNKLMRGDSVEKDLLFKRKDGSEFFGHLKLSSYDRSDPAEKVIVTISDITWRRKVEEQRIQSEKLKGVIEMAGAVCHELNQPLQTILGFSELLMLDLENDNPLYKQLNIIVGQIKRMGQITDKLHKITKYETKDYLKGKIIDINKSAAGAKFEALSP